MLLFENLGKDVGVEEALIHTALSWGARPAGHIRWGSKNPQAPGRRQRDLRADCRWLHSWRADGYGLLGERAGHDFEYVVIGRRDARPSVFGKLAGEWFGDFNV